MASSSTNKQPIVAKIKALLAKTTDAGATPEEALLAAEKAAELIERYNLSLTSLELQAEGAHAIGIYFDDPVEQAAAKTICMEIARYAE